jgi:class 3 adenylate cyclase
MPTEERRLAAIVFTDICGFTELMGRDEAKAMALLEQQRALLKPIISNFKGEWLKEIGDGVLISFPSAVMAVTSALEIQRILAHNPDLTLRIGIHIGDVIRKDGDVFGDGVNIASRLEPLAEPGGICVSERVHEDIKNKPEISTAFQEEQLLKGVDKPIKVYSIFTQMGTQQQPLTETTVSKKEKSRIPILAAGLAIGLLITVFALRTTEEPELTVERVFYTGERIPVAIADFENNTGDATLDGLSGLLITSLEQSNYLTVLTRSRMYDLLKQIGKEEVESVDEKIGREICHRANINSLVLTTIRQFGELYSVDLKILDIEKDEYLYSTNVQAEGKKNIPGLIDEISKQTRISLAEKAEEIEKSQRDIASITTKNLEAYKHYDLGQKAMYALKFGEAGKYYLKALKVDSTFALAYLGLKYCYDWSLDSRADQIITKAVKYIDSVPEKERLYIRAESINDKLSRIPVLEEIIDKYPNEKQAYWEIGDLLYHNDEIDSAIPYFEKCLLLDPSFEYVLQHLGWAFVDMNRHADHIDLANRALEIFPDDKKYKSRQFIAYSAAGRFDEYFRLSEELENAEVKLVNPELIFGNGYLISGDYDNAHERYSKLLSDSTTEITGLLKLKDHSVYRGDYDNYIHYSDRILQQYIEKDWDRSYTNELVERAFTLVFLFDKKKDSRMIVNEIESILHDQEKDMRFDDLSLFRRMLLLDAYAYHGLWDEIDDAKLKSIDFCSINQKRHAALKHQLSGEYKLSVKLIGNTSPSMNVGLQYFYYFHQGTDYRNLNDHKRSLIMFNKMKKSFSDFFSVRKFFHAKLFLYAGLANLELKNYSLAKSNIETFLQIWEPAPEWLKEKKIARETLAKIKDVS